MFRRREAVFLSLLGFRGREFRFRFFVPRFGASESRISGCHRPGETLSFWQAGEVWRRGPRDSPRRTQRREPMTTEAVSHGVDLAPVIFLLTAGVVAVPHA
jgi:hypothetical protein